MLDRQINLFKVDTNAFLTDEEDAHRRYLVKLKKVREKFYKTRVDGRKKTIDKTVKALLNKESALTKYEQCLVDFTQKIKEEEKTWKEYILKSAAEAVEYNNSHSDKHIRELSEQYLSYTDKYTGEKRINLGNVVSMFESTLSRSFGIKQDELTYDIFIVEIYYYDIAQDLIINGFNYNGKHYVYFSSSAGQIRTKKAVFVEEQKYEASKNKLMCGLTVDHINGCGGMNINKFLAYLALSNSATDLWGDVLCCEFDINKCIVVDDFETNVFDKVDYIDYETYNIKPGVEMDVPIPHTDGCGLISPEVSKKNFMVRLPWIKGLLGSFDYKRFIIDGGYSPIVKDIWGKEYDVIKDDIQVIFTKSQLKMYKYYSSWDEYKEAFIEYGCEAGICNLEEDKIPSAKINYQMLQTLYDASDEEIADICNVPNRKIKEISNSLENVLEFFGVNLDNNYENNKDWFQKALKIYPELVTDPASKQDLKDLKDSLVKKYRGGKLDVVGKFTFVLPDLYAFCEWLFGGISNPVGLIENREVFCRLYKNSDELDCLRSPHLYIEHAIRKNVVNKKYRNQYLSDWFNTDAIYVSTHDTISRILQFDVDGDRLLVLAQKTIINMAKRCTQDVYPLYYEMKKAKAEIVNSQNLYNGLKLAFTGGRIGGISNNITKIWNSPLITEEAKSAVKWLCMETNFVIDYAKTLFKPTRPKLVDEIIRAYTKAKVPYFFQYAKDKCCSEDADDNQVENINNSMMNKIVVEIKDNKNMFNPIRNLEGINYLYLLKNMADGYYNEELNKCFDSWNRKYGNNLVIDDENTDKTNISVIAAEVKHDLNQIQGDDDKVINSLVVGLYKEPSLKKKKLLWYVYGEQLYNNLVENLSLPDICRSCGIRTDEELIRGKCFKCRQKEMKEKGYKLIRCVDCGRDVKMLPKSRTNRCDECKNAHRNNYQKELMRDIRKC